MTDDPMNRERWHRIEEVLDEALELPAEEVSAFLDRACAGDGALRADVESLLDADRRAAGFLASPASAAAASLLNDAETPLLLPDAQPGDLEGRDMGPYRILRRIGSGGMGVVYLARDTRLDRTVALKLLPADWAGTAASRERFLREARLVSALDHPNICTLHDIGETDDGRLYLVMSYYPGETLKAKLARGALPVAEAVELAVQVGRGLARAHEAGIVHRDIKPANVIVTDHGEAKVLDFGIAKSAAETGLTRTGSSLGTPGYMSPEQALGQAVDGRTDVWSLAVVLYEMIAGRQPFAADHPQAQIHAILNREPEPLDRGRHDVPAAVTRAVGKAMTKDLGRRTPSVNAFIADLTATTGAQALAAAAHRRHWRALAAAGVLAAALLGTGGWWIWRGAHGAPSSGGAAASVSRTAAVAAVPAVGVLPFVNRTGDASLDWYGEGVAGLVRDSLSASRHLQVVSGLRADPLAAVAGEGERARRAAESGITVLVIGEILPGQGGLTLAARCVETRTGRQLAARRFDGLAPKDLLHTADEVALEARKALNVPPTEAVDVFAADFATDNPEAYASFISGSRHLAAKRYDEAAVAFSRALRQAPEFTMARYRLAQTLATIGRTDEALVEIRKAVAKADRLADRDARYVRAFEAYVSRHYDDAVNAYRELSERYPYEIEGHYYLALLLRRMQRYDDALAQIAVLTRLEPENPNLWDLSGGTHLLKGNLHQAVQDFEHLLTLEPGSAEGHKMLGDAYRAEGELSLAASSYSEALRLDSRLDRAAVALAVTEALGGDRAAAERRLEKLVANRGASPRDRLDAAFELASLLRAEGRFRRAAEILASLEAPLASEKVRESLALSVRGTSLLELGDLSAARSLIDRAVRSFAGTPTRYLFARGLVELRENRLKDLEATVAKIQADALPADNPDRTEEKAAACLLGMRELQEGRPQGAVNAFARAVNLRGTEYASYKLWLAKAYLAAGVLSQALAAAHEASQPSDPANPRLDLELDRTRALLVLAQVHKAFGHPAEASDFAKRFLDRWQGADPGLPELGAAHGLVSVSRASPSAAR